jgi:hypothetical protein
MKSTSGRLDCTRPPDCSRLSKKGLTYARGRPLRCANPLRSTSRKRVFPLLILLKMLREHASCLCNARPSQLRYKSWQQITQHVQATISTRVRGMLRASPHSALQHMFAGGHAKTLTCHSLPEARWQRKLRSEDAPRTWKTFRNET